MNLFVVGRVVHLFAAEKEGFLVETVDDQVLREIVMGKNFQVVAVVVGTRLRMVFLVVAEMDMIPIVVVMGIDLRKEFQVLVNQFVAEMDVR